MVANALLRKTDLVMTLPIPDSSPHDGSFALGERFDGDQLNDMGQVRVAIDALDRALVALLNRRLACIVAASRLKSSPDEARVVWRVADVIAKVRENASNIGFDPDLAEEIWREMMERCIAFEQKVLTEKSLKP
jgi:isochorismate pyruvate lyase